MDVSAACRPQGIIHLQWRCQTPPGQLPPVDFAAFLSPARPLDLSAPPAATAAYTQDGAYALDLSAGVGAWFIALIARSASAAVSPIVNIGPIVLAPPPAAAPAARFDGVA